MHKFRCSCSAFSLGIDTCSCHSEVHRRRKRRFRVRTDDSAATQLENVLESAIDKIPRHERWPTIWQDLSISQTLRRLDDATIGVCGTEVRRGEGAARRCGVPRFLVLPGTGLICVCWWLVVQLLRCYRRSEWLVVFCFGLGRGRKARSLE